MTRVRARGLPFPEENGGQEGGGELHKQLPGRMIDAQTLSVVCPCSSPHRCLWSLGWGSDENVTRPHLSSFLAAAASMMGP